MAEHSTARLAEWLASRDIQETLAAIPRDERGDAWHALAGSFKRGVVEPEKEIDF